MFEYVRTHQRLMQFILLLFIVPSFALFGVSSYFGAGNADAVATVGGDTISQLEFDEALRNQMNQMRQQLGEQFDEARFNTPEVKQSILDRLITQRVLKAEAKKENLSISDAVLQQTILAIPGLTLPSGAFDYEGYKNVLANRGMTPEMYESGLRQDLAVEQLIAAVQDSAFAPKTVISQISKIMGQQRDIQSMEFDAAEYVKQLKITDAMLKTYYEQHSAQFSVPESAKIEYVVLNRDAIASQATASDDEIKSFYDQNIKNFSTDEQRRASHILIKTDNDNSSAGQAAAKAKAGEILALVRKQPARFAELAKQYSQDEGSAQKGGDLGYFSKGMMVKPFEDAAFQLKQGKVSDLIKSDFGYHIIHLTAIKPTSVKPLAEVKDQITDDIKKQKATKQFREMAETFTNTVYEQSNSLKPVVDKLKLNLETAADITRDPNSANVKNKENPILLDPKFLKALFSDDVVKNKRNMEALEVAPTTLVSARIVEYKPASTRSFDEVKDVVTMFVKLAESEALAKKAGEEKLAALIKAEAAKPADAAGFGNAKTISRTKQEGVPPEAFNLLMNADTSKLPAYVGVNLAGQGYVVYRINKVQQAATDAATEAVTTAQLSQQLAAMLGSEAIYEFVAMLKQQGKVKIIKPFSATQ